MDKAFDLLMLRWIGDLDEACAAVRGCNNLDTGVYVLIHDVMADMNSIVASIKGDSRV